MITFSTLLFFHILNLSNLIVDIIYEIQCDALKHADSEQYSGYSAYPSLQTVISLCWEQSPLFSFEIYSKLLLTVVTVVC